MFGGSKGVVGDENGLHFFEIGFSIERRVAAEEEVGNYTNGPDVAVIYQSAEVIETNAVLGLHRLAMSRLLEDLRRHIPGCSTRCREHVKALFVHYPRKTEICNQ